MGTAVLGLGVTDILKGDLADGVIFLYGGLLCLIGIGQGVLTRVLTRRGTTRTIHASTIPETGETAVVIPYSGSLFWLIFSLPAMLLAGASTIAASSIAATMTTQDATYIVINIASIIAVGYLLACVSQFCSKKIARGYIALSPSGIYHRSWSFTSFVPWQHVIAVWPFDGSGPVIGVQATANADGWSRRTSRFWKQPESDFGRNLTVRGMYLSVDPALAYHALQFYFSKPQARSELAGDAGVRRLRRVDIPVSQSHA